jgi:ketosteroid isomerase-like protein
MTPTVSSTQANATVIGELYAAFGRGDLPSIMETLDDKISWDADSADNYAQRGGGLDHFRPRHGRAGAGQFFAVLGGYTFNEFRVEAIIAGDQYVVAKVAVDVTTPTGGRARDEELHLWTFDAAGRIIATRHYLDTAKHLAASRGYDTTAT